MTVWHLISTMRTEHQTPEQTARNRDLPLEAVLEAMHYYILHKDIVEADNEEEKRYLIAQRATSLINHALCPNHLP